MTTKVRTRWGNLQMVSNEVTHCDQRQGDPQRSATRQPTSVSDKATRSGQRQGDPRRSATRRPAAVSDEATSSDQQRGDQRRSVMSDQRRASSLALEFEKRNAPVHFKTSYMGSGRGVGSDSTIDPYREFKNLSQSHSPQPQAFSGSSSSTPTLPVSRFSRDESMKQQRRDKGLCYRCRNPFRPGHYCSTSSSTFSLMEVDEEGNPMNPKHVPIDGEAKEEEASFNGILGTPTSATMKLSGKLHGHEVLLLIDNGSTHNFISEKLVEQVKLHDSSVQTFGVQVRDCFIIQCDEISKSVSVKLSGEHQVPTPMDKLTTEDKKKLSLNAKALNVLFCALGQDEFARVSSCKSAKEAWKLLEATHEGDKDTKATKIALGTSEYENFKMKAGESVQDMNKRFNLIVNNLSKLNKVYPTSEINTKIIFSLPREWHSLVVNLLPKCADVETSTIWSSLYSRELLLKKMKEEEQVPIIKKTMELKIDDHLESEGESDEELAMFKRYKKFMKWNKGESSKRFPSNKGKPNQITCYECGNVGHIKPECPKLKKKEELKKGKKKALKVTWDDLNSDESDSDQSQE
ncbi:unnamed protein product [Cuscuta campestris]|uniref:CCHC-type domain-containing protein n=1 Tax=Cuscuta campestris TaxID=132261 RepID=A0A484MIM0_9ASTE|nr:unnamed protein product [Cuscuta campestris]